MKIAIKLVRYSEQTELRFHMLRYLQSTVPQFPFLCQLVDFQVESDSILVVEESDSSPSASGTFVKRQDSVDLISFSDDDGALAAEVVVLKDDVSMLKPYLYTLCLLHSFGVRGVDLRSRCTVSGRFYDYLRYANDPSNDLYGEEPNHLVDLANAEIKCFDELEDCRRLGALLQSFNSDKTAAPKWQPIIQDLSSGQFTIFDILSRHSELVPQPSYGSSPACTFQTSIIPFDKQTPIHSAYARWQADGRDALREYWMKTKRAYFPIMQMPISFNIHSNHLQTQPTSHRRTKRSSKILQNHSTGTKALNSSSSEVLNVFIDLEQYNSVSDTGGSVKLSAIQERALRWIAVFNGQSNYSDDYVRFIFNRLNKSTCDLELDKQLEVDLPRCHSYHPLINSDAGQLKLKRLILALFEFEDNNGNIVYWQGLDSIASVFLSVFFYHDHWALHCLNEFIRRYMACFFVDDNSVAIHTYLEIFQTLIAFFDPELSAHVTRIEFWPDLYAIPWFLTLFSHVLSMEQLSKLWDAMFALPIHDIVIGAGGYCFGSAQPNTTDDNVKEENQLKIKNTLVMSIFIATAIMRASRHNLISADFHECIHVFSEMNFQQDIAVLVDEAVRMMQLTPSSLVHKLTNVRYLDDHKHTPVVSSLVSSNEHRRPSMFGSGRIRIGTICADDILVLRDNCVFIDVRSGETWSECAHLPGSLSVPCWQGIEQDVLREKLHKFAKEYLNGSIGDTNDRQQRLFVVCGVEETDLEVQVAFTLIQLLLPGVVILRGGMNSFDSSRTHNFTCSCMGNNSKNSELTSRLGILKACDEYESI